MPLHASALHHWLFTTVVGLFWCRHSFQFSGIQILLTDHVHQRSGVDNKFSSFWFKGWWRRQAPVFSEGEKNAVFIFSPLIWRYFWPASTLLHGHLALATPSLPETDPQNFWSIGVTLMRFHLGKYIRAMDFGLERLAWRITGLSESNTSDWLQYVWALPQNRWRHRRLHILIYTTQLSCILQYSHCTFVTILFWTFR